MANGLPQGVVDIDDLPQTYSYRNLLLDIVSSVADHRHRHHYTWYWFLPAGRLLLLLEVAAAASLVLPLLFAQHHYWGEDCLVCPFAIA
jgi:hypothetical protein